ncbi:hypothetical protein T01_8687 [Trichinella spiralis]|uniref:Uncharacterized protein n=1 Tax=Trichinella spiralis TaxID=6334 RepID=A0A0V1BEN6_TRISP|nr:hypothetical protein T01_8687 [Trichinella spiralis]
MTTFFIACQLLVRFWKKLCHAKEKELARAVIKLIKVSRKVERVFIFFTCHTQNLNIKYNIFTKMRPSHGRRSKVLRFSLLLRQPPNMSVTSRREEALSSVPPGQQMSKHSICGNEQQQKTKSR